jgi:hypothetical protein
MCIDNLQMKKTNVAKPVFLSSKKKINTALYIFLSGF